MRSPLRPLGEAERIALALKNGYDKDNLLLTLDLTPEERRAALDPGLPDPKWRDAMEPTSGSETSEFGLTRLVIWAGLGLDVVSIALEALKGVGLNFGWLPVALAIVGTLAALLAKLGYTRSRTAIKIQEATQAGTPHVVELITVVRRLVEDLKSMPPNPDGTPALKK